MQGPWPHGCRLEITNRIGVKGAQKAEQAQLFQSGHTQVVLEIENWLTQEQWTNVTRREVNRDMLQQWARICAEFGATKLSEPSVAAVVSVMLHAAVGSQAALEMPISAKLRIKLDFKTKLKQQGDVARIPRYAVYPSFPRELGVQVMTSLYGDGEMPHPNPLPQQDLRVVKQQMPAEN